MSDNLRTILADNVKRGRKRLGISQDELAERSGLHRTYVGAVERGERNISLSSLSKIADALGEAPSALLSVAADNG